MEKFSQPPTQAPRLMKIIPAQVLSELVAIFLLYLISLTFFFVLVGMLLEMRNQGLPLAKMPMLIPCAFPFSQYMAIPFVMLLTVVTVYSRMNISREITALQTSGISSFRIILPALIIALGLSFYTTWMCDLSISWGMAQTQRIVLSASQDILYRELSTKKSVTLERQHITLTVLSVDGKELRGPIVTKKDPDNSQPTTISAKKAKIEVGRLEDLWNPKSGKRNALENLYSPEDYKDGVVKLTFSEVHSGGAGGEVQIPEEQIVILPLSDIPLFMSAEGQKATFTALGKLPKLIETKKEEIRRIEEDMRLDSAQLLLFGNFDDYGKERWTQYHNLRRSCNDDIRRAHIERHRRAVVGFSCFCFAIVAAPLAVWKGKHGALQLIATSFLPLMVFYYPAFMAILNAAKKGTVVPAALWIPNIVLLLLGIYLMKRAA